MLSACVAKLLLLFSQWTLDGDYWAAFCEKIFSFQSSRKTLTTLTSSATQKRDYPWQYKSSPTPYLVYWSSLDSNWQTLPVSPQVGMKFIISSVKQPSIRPRTALGSYLAPVPALLKDFFRGNFTSGAHLSISRHTEHLLFTVFPQLTQLMGEEPMGRSHE